MLPPYGTRFLVVKDQGFSSSDTPKSKYEKLENRISEFYPVSFLRRTASFDASQPGADELEALLRQKDNETALGSSPPLRTSSGNPLGDGHEIPLLTGTHPALPEGHPS